MAKLVFVAPHLDDVALSCGASVAKLARGSRIQIVTVFAKIPSRKLTSFAEFQHRRWQLPEGEAVQSRHKEDTLATAALGERAWLSWLQYLDAIYRDPAYSSDDALFGRVLESDMSLIRAIAHDLDQGSDAEYFVPLGVGGHVDHVLVNRAARLLALSGATVWGYADLPYALDDDALAATLDQMEGDEIRDIALDDEALQRRWDAVSCYASQLPVLFRDIPEPRAAMEAFAHRWSTAGPVDRFWRIRPAG